jgi:OFA family oxalate/formate antiporter-like MFS transporter
VTYLSVVAWATAGAQGGAWVVAVVVAAYAAGPVLGAPLATLGVEHLGWRATLVTAGIAVAGVIWPGSRGIPARREVPADRVTNGAGELEDVGALVALWVLFLGMFTPGLLAFAHGASIAVERGISPGVAGGVVSLMALGNVGGRLLTAPLTTVLTLRGALWVTLVALALTLVLLAWLSSSTIVVLGLPILGVQYGAASALVPMATPAVSGEHRFATAYGRVFSSWGVAGVLGPTVVAALHEGGDEYMPTFKVSLLAVALAAPALVLVQRRLAAED